MATIRPYIITHKSTGARRLVRAASRTTARSHVARDQFTVEIASANDVIDLLQAGLAVEDARADAADKEDGKEDPPAGNTDPVCNPSTQGA